MKDDGARYVLHIFNVCIIFHLVNSNNYNIYKYVYQDMVTYCIEYKTATHISGVFSNCHAQKG